MSIRVEHASTSSRIGLVIVAVACVGVMCLVKFLMKRGKLEKDKIWTRSWAIVFILIGLAPVLASLAVVYFLSLDFQTVVQVPGLLKGVLASWVAYLIGMGLCHLGPWRYDLL